MNTGSKISRSPVVVLLGPTAVGKTAMLVRLLGESGEVINADSRQVYRHIRIGTAKPSCDERNALPHHLIDVRDPDEQFTAGDFVKCADRLVREIHARGMVPVVSGGTGFYLRSFINGLPESPPAFPELREKLRREMRRRDLSSMHEMLAEIDPVSARRIPETDRYRIERALEVYRGTGRPLSSFNVPDTPREDFDFLVIGVYREREELYRRIDARVDRMFASGLVDEIAGLLRSGWGPEDPGLRTIGYREILGLRRTGCGTLEETKVSIARNTRHYAKRQMTFFRGIAGTRWFHADDESSIEREINSFIGSGNFGKSDRKTTGRE